MIKLPAIISDNMALQAGMKVPVWGKASPKEKIKVKFCGKEVSTIADKKGDWKLYLGPLSAGGPFEMEISGKNKIVIKNILVGEVWACGGQSNMQFQVELAGNGKEEVKNANYPDIRLYFATIRPSKVPLSGMEGEGLPFWSEAAKKWSTVPLNDIEGKWVECSPKTAGGFSASGYYFGRSLHKALNVPVGLINISLGATYIETWMSEDILKANPKFKHLLKLKKSMLKDPAKANEEYNKKLLEWDDKVYHKDPGNKGFEKGWADPKLNTKDWGKMEVPGYWETKGMDIDGAVWYREDFNIPDKWAGNDLMLSLGCIDDFDTTYFNGVKVGAIGKETPNWCAVPRNYVVPSTLVKPGKNTIAVRIFDHFANGGFCGQPGDMKIKVINRKDLGEMPIAGEWLYKIELELKPNTIPPKPLPPYSPETTNSINGLFNGMINPVIPFGIKGVIWSQGENNLYGHYDYHEMFASLIKGWRKHWGQGDFPFIFVQSTIILGLQTKPVEDDPYSWLREAQMQTLKVKNTAMTVSIDIGEVGVAHASNKQEAGYRFYLAALGLAYGKDIVYSGPLYKSMRIEGKKIRLFFEHIGSGLEAKGGRELKGFAIAGKDKEFLWANTKIDKDTVLVWNDKIKKPAAVRYGWANNPIGNLTNNSKLPASPFRTDKW